MFYINIFCYFLQIIDCNSRLHCSDDLFSCFFDTVIQFQLHIGEFITNRPCAGNISSIIIMIRCIVKQYHISIFHFMIVGIVMPDQSSFARGSNSKICRAIGAFILINKIAGSHHLVFIHTGAGYPHSFIKSQCANTSTFTDNSDFFFILHPSHHIQNRCKIFNRYQWKTFLYFINKIYFFRISVHPMDHSYG